MRQEEATMVATEEKQAQFDTDVYVHESSYVDKNVTIGKGTKIWHFTHIMSNSQLGEDCRIGQNVVISPGVAVGNNVKIQNNVSVYTGVTLEDDVFCGPSMVFTNVINPRCEVPRNTEDDFLKTLVKKGASIGANATVVCGVTLGKYAFVGAGSVVTKDVPDYALVYGNPARQHGWMCFCGERLPLKFQGSVTCSACDRSYEQGENGLNPKD